MSKVFRREKVFRRGKAKSSAVTKCSRRKKVFRRADADLRLAGDAGDCRWSQERPKVGELLRRRTLPRRNTFSRRNTLELRHNLDIF